MNGIPCGAHAVARKAFALTARLNDRTGDFLRKRSAWVALALFAILAIQIRTWWVATPDALGYLSISRSVWSHDGLSRLGQRQLYYAPGFPLLISPIFLFPHKQFLLLSLARLGMALLSLLAAYFWARNLVKRPAALMLTALVAVNVSFEKLYRLPLSDLPMMMWLFWSALAMRKLLTARSAGAGAVWCGVAALLVAAAAFTRQSALAIGLGMAAALFLRATRHRISWLRATSLASLILFPTTIGLCALANWDRTLAGAHGLTYIDQIRSMSLYRQIGQGPALRSRQIAQLVILGGLTRHALPHQWRDPDLLIFLPLSALIAAGWAMLVRRFADPLLWAVPFYVALYVLWPYHQGTRFFTPILPILLTCAWPILERLRNTRWLLLTLLCFAHLTVATSRWLREIRRDGAEYRTAYPALTNLAPAIAANRGPVAAVGLSVHAQYWLVYLIDRQLDYPPRYTAPRKPLSVAVPNAVEWVVEPLGAPVPADFTSVRVAQPFRLAHRITHSTIRGNPEIRTKLSFPAVPSTPKRGTSRKSR